MPVVIGPYGFSEVENGPEAETLESYITKVRDRLVVLFDELGVYYNDAVKEAMKLLINVVAWQNAERVVRNEDNMLEQGWIQELDRSIRKATDSEMTEQQKKFRSESVKRQLMVVRDLILMLGHLDDEILNLSGALFDAMMDHDKPLPKEIIDGLVRKHLIHKS